MEELKRLLGYVLLIASIVALFGAIAYTMSLYVYSRADFMEKPQSGIFYSSSASFDYEAACAYKVMRVECIDPVNGSLIPKSNITISTDYLGMLRVFSYTSPKVRVDLAQICSMADNTTDKLSAGGGVCSGKPEAYVMSIACTNGVPHVVFYSPILPTSMYSVLALAVTAIAGVLASRRLLA